MTAQSESAPARSTVLMIASAAMLWLLPLGIYWAVLFSAPVVDAARALEMLGEPSQRAVLVDVRPLSAYEERHIASAISLPLEKILHMQGPEDMPSFLQGKTLLLVCDTGVVSAQAARHFNGLGIPDIYYVRGGIQEWGRAWPQFGNNPYSHLQLAGGVTQVPFRAMPPGEQAAAALALLWIKPVYMLLSAALSAILLKNKAYDMRLLGWSLLVFLIGEGFCAINYMFLQDSSYFAEYMHSYSMVVAFALAAYALMEGLDARLIHFSHADQRCAMLPVCGACAKYQKVRCGLRRIAQLTGAALMLLAFIPLLSPLSTAAYNTQILTVNHYYVRPVALQLFEARYSPSITILLIGLALLVMQRTPHITLHPLARVLFCAGIGFFGFSMFRVTLGLLYSEALVWATFWEELTELMFVTGVMYILWVFQRTLQLDLNLRLPNGTARMRVE